MKEQCVCLLIIAEEILHGRFYGIISGNDYECLIPVLKQ